MILHLPCRRNHFPYQTAIHDIVWVDKMNILGITVSDTLTSLHFNITSPPLLLKVLFLFMLLKILALMGSTEVRC